MPGLRVHLAGSAAPACEPLLLASAHTFMAAFCRHLIDDGEGILVGAGGEPRGDAGLPCIFDWTALEVISTAPTPGTSWSATRSGRYVAVGSQRGIEKIPEDRAPVWRACKGRSDFKLDVTPPRWRMAGLIRDQQLLHGDVLVTLGGGAGVELLAHQYREDGKPVIPIHVEIGSLNNDGNGGSRYLQERALNEIDTFFHLRDGAGDAVSRLSDLRLEADSDPEQLAAATARLIADLRPRPAFYVRLLDPSHSEFHAVEKFFREVVDPVMQRNGFRPQEIGMYKPEDTFMNVEIFKLLHRAALVVVDLSGVRPNCMMELGYALGRRRRYLLSAIKGTRLPFDPDKIPTYFWDPDLDADSMISQYQDRFEVFSEPRPLAF
ncbi:MAG TPA: hypothetical protein VFY69_11095 [Solirubrobacterales bacterium]|nr:hypothetical protein [Solirubrobacterales bacterium]